MPLILSLLIACNEEANDQISVATGLRTSEFFTPVPTLDETKITVGKIIYVPVYSHVYVSNKGMRELATMLSIRNTDPDQRIIVTAVQYYDSSGRLVEDYVSSNHALAPLASTEIIIGQTDNRGGAGANFIVKWVAEQAVNPPIIEAVMTGISGTQGLSFIRSGQVIEP